MEDVKDPVEERPWYKKPLVMVTSVGAVLLILGGAYFSGVFAPGKKRKFTKSKARNPLLSPVNPFEQIPVIFDDAHYPFGVAKATILMHLYNLSKPEGKYKKALEPLVKAFLTEPSTKAFSRLLRKDEGFKSSITPSWSYHCTGFADLECLLVKSGLKVFIGKAAAQMTPEEEFRVLIRPADSFPEAPENGRAVAILANRLLSKDYAKWTEYRAFLKQINGDNWIDQSGKEYTDDDIAEAKWEVDLIVYQYEEEK